MAQRILLRAEARAACSRTTLVSFVKDGGSIKLTLCSPKAFVPALLPKAF
jgi:hypothetical protein